MATTSTKSRPRAIHQAPRRRAARLALLAAAGALIALGVPARAAFTTFESGQVRPLAISPDGMHLFAVNTPDNRLEIFDLQSGQPVHADSVEVGLEPVAVAARTNGEVWVVNHLSDSVSIVDASTVPARVVRTLLVGDEPRDIVFAGPLAAGGRRRAFVTTAHRGQNNPNDPQLTTPGIGRADVWVFDSQSLGSSLGGTPETIVTLFGDTPRALATNAAASTVYAAVFHSGNQTTTLNEGVVCNGGASASSCNVFGKTMPGGLPAPNTNHDGVAGPETGLIVKFNPSNGHWEDQLARNWNNAVNFSLPDYDVFAIDANASPPVETRRWSGVGTVLFNMAVNPTSGKVYVSNTDAHNEVRFEGPGTFGGSTVRGHLHEARITIVDPSVGPPASSVVPRHLNKHINYAVVPSPVGVAAKSLATPVGMALSSDGTRLYLAAFSSSKVGIFDTAQLEADTFVPDSSAHIPLSGGGPSGLALDEARHHLYVLTRFDNALKVINTDSASEIQALPLFNPEPDKVKRGRHVLYDAAATSSNGEASCASCHIFGDFDSLAWDLGNPDDSVLLNLNPFRVADPIGMSFPNHHPMKGPMTTQSLRGMANAGPMHWRGDRSGANDTPPGNALDEKAAFKRFIVAFSGLLGRSGPISDSDMNDFADFILEVTYPPNPIRALDNGLTTDQQAGHDFFTKAQSSDVFQPCHGCHALDPANGFFGTDGFSSFEFEAQLLKIPHLRNLYQKVGMFGMPQVAFLNGGDNGAKGPQVRGFGFLHDGSVDTVFRFHNATVFNQNNPGGFPIANPGGFPNGVPGDPQRRQVEQFMLAFDSNLAPIVGQQITRSNTNSAVVAPRITLLLDRASHGECDVVVKGLLGGVPRGWVRLANGSFQSDRAGEAPIGSATLISQADTAGQERTFTCVPPGSGQRIGVDRDEDGFLDRDEIDAGTDPADPASFPGSGAVARIRSSSMVLRDDPVPPLDPVKRKLAFRSAKFGGVASGVVLPALGGADDPAQHGAVLVVYRADGSAPATTVSLPASHWQAKLQSGVLKRYVYSDSAGAAGPIRSATLTAGLLTIQGKGMALVDLSGAPQGAMALRLQLGADLELCAAAPARTGASPAASAGFDSTTRFVAVPNTPAPAVCPLLPGP